MVKLDKICREANVMLVFARSYGLTGFVRLSVKVICPNFIVVIVLAFLKVGVRISMLLFKRVLGHQMDDLLNSYVASPGFEFSQILCLGHFLYW